MAAAEAAAGAPTPTTEDILVPDPYGVKTIFTVHTIYKNALKYIFDSRSIETIKIMLTYAFPGWKIEAPTRNESAWNLIDSKGHLISIFLKQSHAYGSFSIGVRLAIRTIEDKPLAKWSNALQKGMLGRVKEILLRLYNTYVKLQEPNKPPSNYNIQNIGHRAALYRALLQKVPTIDPLLANYVTSFNTTVPSPPVPEWKQHRFGRINTSLFENEGGGRTRRHRRGRSRKHKH